MLTRGIPRPPKANTRSATVSTTYPLSTSTTSCRSAQDAITGGAKRFTPFVLGGLGLGMCKTTEKTRTAMELPIGIGVKYKINERVNLGLEWAVNFTTSDWLDGVKDPYGIESSGMFKNTDAFHRLQLSLTYSFSPKCINCNKE